MPRIDLPKRGVLNCASCRHGGHAKGPMRVRISVAGHAAIAPIGRPGGSLITGQDLPAISWLERARIVRIAGSKNFHLPLGNE